MQAYSKYYKLAVCQTCYTIDGRRQRSAMISQLLSRSQAWLFESTTPCYVKTLMIIAGLLIVLLFGQKPHPVFANPTLEENTTLALPVSKLGIHILSPSELNKANDLLTISNSNDVWHFVTVPLTLDDLHKEKEWIRFFQQANEDKIIPIIRLASRFENEVWIKPTRKNIVDQVAFLSRMPWGSHRRYLIVGNEVNHAPEWGGELDPVAYTNFLTFTSQWARAVDDKFFILPAAMDLDAPNSSNTKEAIGYVREMLAYEPKLFEYIDGWNSHSYPNPAFLAPPTATGKNSLRGYQIELATIAEYTDQKFPVFITETGWRQTRQNQRKLLNYYDYALQNIWNDPRVAAVTPFVLQGAPGHFAAFSFLDAQQQPTAQYVAYQAVLKKLAEASKLSGLLINEEIF